jgi:hypothetical protein
MRFYGSFQWRHIAAGSLFLVGKISNFFQAWTLVSLSSDRPRLEWLYPAVTTSWKSRWLEIQNLIASGRLMSRWSIGEKSTIPVLLKRLAAFFPLKFAVTALDSCHKRLRREIILQYPRHRWRFPTITRRKHTSKPDPNSHEPDLEWNVYSTIWEFPCREHSSFNRRWLQQKGLKHQVEKNVGKPFPMFVPNSCSGVI